MTDMRQKVTIFRSADRHGVLHKRDFSSTYEIEVPAGRLSDVLSAVAAVISASELAEGKYSIFVDWPHEHEHEWVVDKSMQLESNPPRMRVRCVVCGFIDSVSMEEARKLMKHG